MDEATSRIISEWLQNNPYKVYACSYDDQLPREVVQALLEGSEDALSDFEFEIIDNAAPYVDWDEIRADLIREAKLGPAITESDEFEELFESERWIDASEFLSDAARHTHLHIVATPHLDIPGASLFEEDQSEALFLFPHGYLSDEENARRAKQLLDVLGIENPDEAETCYEFDTLKVIGTLSVPDLIEHGPPTHITIGPEDVDQLFTHNRVNGSGGLGTVRPTKTVTLPAQFRVDDGDRYGVDSVYGLTGQMWRYGLRVSRPE